MPEFNIRDGQRALDGWAHSQGYADFDTYVAAGGSFKHAIEDIEAKRHRLHLALAAIYRWTPSAHKPEPADAALAQAEAQVTGDEVR